MVVKVGISGFGRIGRCLFGINYEIETEKKFEIVAIKDIVPIKNTAYLLKYDSNYGNFKGRVTVEGNNLVVDDKKIPYFCEPDTNKVPWDQFGVDILVEASGQPSRLPGLMLKGGLTNVIYTRNFENADITIIYGFNHQEYNPTNHKIVSASTCTGTAIIPIANIINSNMGIESAHLVTIHPVLSEQRLIDVSHHKFNLGRNAIVSIIPTSTGITESLGNAIPELKNKLTAISYRVPTTIVSAIDASFYLKKETTAKEINSMIKECAENELKGIIGYDEGYFGHSKVSIDFLKSPLSVVVFGLETQSKGKNISLTLFHDNEWGYCYRLHDLINHIYNKNNKLK